MQIRRRRALVLVGDLGFLGQRAENARVVQIDLGLWER